MSKELDQYRREVRIHLEHNKEKMDIAILHLEKINGRLDKAENNITSIKSIGITLYSLMGVILAWLGVKE